MKPIEDAAQFLVGTEHVDADGTPDCVIVDSGHQRDLDLSIEVPPTDLRPSPPASSGATSTTASPSWSREHRTTLVFVNTRRLAERVAHTWRERLGEEHVGAHHGSLSKERRLAWSSA